MRWHHLGDRDTSFYHKCVVQRVANNHNYYLRDTDDRLIGNAEEIKSHTADYFKGILGHTDLQESSCTIAELQDLLSFCCSDTHCQVLIRPVSEDEITKTVFAMPLSKSPGPDGYSVEFYRSTWSIVGKDVIAAVSEFFRNGRLLKDINKNCNCSYSEATSSLQTW